MTRCILLAAALVIGATPPPGRCPLAFAQAGNTTASLETKERSSNAIAGRVVNESGEAIRNGTVLVFGRSRQPARRVTSLDEQGRFRVDDLPRGVYFVSVQIPGYVLVGETGEPTSYRPGDTASLVVRKGGAITGTVTGSSGEPVVAIRISAIPLRDLEGRPIQRSGSERSRYTDDRGVYRLFGLSPGYYLVVAGSKPPGSQMLTAFDEDVPTYYPSSTRDTATEIAVRSGDEASGVDIKYRGGLGNAVSGLVTGVAATGSSLAGVNVRLMRAEDDAIEAMTFTGSRDTKSSFAFYGVPEGEYYVSAQRPASEKDDGAGSRPVRVNVRASDVTGVELALVPFGSIAGRVLFEVPAQKDQTVKCKTTRPPSVEESLITVRRDQIDPKERSLPTLASIVVAPGAKGEVLLQGLDAARYWIETRILDEVFYVRAITLPGTGRNANSIDVARSGVAVKQGERVSGLSVVLAAGAASIHGRVLSQKDGAALSDRLRVYLVPAEQQAADDPLRYAEAAVQSDGSFALTNAAPGRYWLVAREVSDVEATDRSQRRLSWTLNSRATLRSAAVASNLMLDLQPCQRVVDYEFSYAPLPSPRKPTRP